MVDVVIVDFGRQLFHVIDSGVFTESAVKIEGKLEGGRGRGRGEGERGGYQRRRRSVLPCLGDK